MDKIEVQKNIGKLIEKYEKARKLSQIGKYSEEDTKKDFILPLFSALGWNTSDRNEVTAEESQSSGRVDYGFYLNDRVKFYLEAKSLRTDLHKEEFANQAVRYSWNKGVTWAVLTDFESIIVFNAQDITKQLSDKRFFEISYSQYLERFDQLRLLSRESFEEDKISKEAEKYGKKLQKISVGVSLYEDLNECRKLLTHDLSAWNEKVPKDLLDEGVQKIIDRLIFIRVAEDRGIESPTLIPLIREWENRSDRNKVPLYKSMIAKFRELDDVYNSNLFSPHPFEEWEEYSGITKKVVDILYGKKGYYEYDFQVIPADILGSVYENYLGYKLLQSKKGMTVHVDAGKRKEQGIYYTPDYIVEYIVNNTLKPVLDRCNSINDLKKIKVLDPACGSGSFLLKALEAIYKKYLEFGNSGGVFTKLEILLNNIYGVDLDHQAVEIARLNLLISALDKRIKLPLLDKNIKNGNSLISGTEEKLVKYFGNNFRAKVPFNWEEEFPEVSVQGGFTAIIGNPPYISYYSKQSQANTDTTNELEYFINNYDFIEDKRKLGRFNTLMFFIEKSIKLLKPGGYIGFLVDTNIHSNPSEEIRKYIVEKTTLKKVVDNIHAFEDVGSSQAILIMQKIRSALMNKVYWLHLKNDVIEKIASGKQIEINVSNEYSFKAPKNPTVQKILSKIKIQTPLVKIVGKKFVRTCITFTGKKDHFVIDNKEKTIDYPLLEGSNALPYPYAKPKFNKYIRYDLQVRDDLNEEYVKEAQRDKRRSPMVIGLGDLNLFKAPKIFIRLSDRRITATFTSAVVCADLSLYILTLPNLQEHSKDLSLYYLLALLNSNLLTFFMRESNRIGNLETGTPQIRLDDIRSIPIVVIPVKQQEKIANYARMMVDLNIKIDQIQKNSDNWNKIQEEINRIGKKIDKEVYKLYALTPEEIGIVESSNR